jgi:hypothetical protein
MDPRSLGVRWLANTDVMKVQYDRVLRLFHLPYLGSEIQTSRRHIICMTGLDEVKTLFYLYNLIISRNNATLLSLCSTTTITRTYVCISRHVRSAEVNKR